MLLNESITDNIVNTLRNTIDYEINFMNQEGIIISSSDASRIGQEHEGAKVVLKTKKTLLVDSNDIYSGTRKGVNMPIFLENQLIGVIGITGSPSEVSKFIDIVTKMTEILLKENLYKNFQFNIRHQHQTLIEWIKRDYMHNDEIAGLAKSLNIDTDKECFFINGKISEFKMTNNKYESDLYFDIKREIDRSDDNTIFSLIKDEIDIIYFGNYNDAIEVCKNINALLSYNYSINIFFGIGSKVENIFKLRKSFKEALYITKSKMNKLDKNNILVYTDMDLGLILYNQEKANIKFYINKILGKLDDNDFSEYKNIFKIYTENNGSIKASSEKLFIHKNTLQYKLKKFQKITGYDFRNLNDYVLISIAFKLQSLVDNGVY